MVSEGEARRPGTNLPPVTRSPKNEFDETGGTSRTQKESVLGMSLGRLTSKSSPSNTMNSSLGRKTFQNHDLTQKITKRYTTEVKLVDSEHQQQYVTLDKTGPIKPDEQDMARRMKNDLDSLQKKAGVAETSIDGWDKLLGSDSFQKQLQFLQTHARTGHFIESYGNEGRYEGEFLHGMRHGKGQHEFRGEVYDGDWKWDQRHGWGTLTLGDGSQTKGEWQSGKPDGYISQIDAHGTITYEGEYKAGKRHGFGRQIFEGGDMYDGSWKEGKLHDRGVYYFTNGDKLYGMWNMGRYDGIGVFHYADGSVSRRTYKDGHLMSVQDYEASSQRFGKTLTRDGMQRHTRDKQFPKDIFLLNSV